jgi:hypothetical protein
MRSNPVHDHVCVVRLTCNVLDQIVKAAWIDTSAFV